MDKRISSGKGYLCALVSAQILSSVLLLANGLQLTSSSVSNHVPDQNEPLSRRSVLTSSAAAAAAASSSILSWTIRPLEALAAPPITTEELFTPGANVERFFRPRPIKALRCKIDYEFAVLLMRSSYEALDQLDCVAMDQFQRDFFILRSTEYEKYIGQLGPGLVYQGPNRDNPDIMCPCVSDPYYFDFLSFAQYATISREINNSPPVVFEERDDDGVNLMPRIVRRDPSLTNDKLATTHDLLVGTSIVERFDEIFGGTKSAIPNNGSLLDAIVQLKNLFLINGYAWEGVVSQPNPTEFAISLSSPATLWSGRVLKLRNANPCNCFLLKAAKVLASRQGYDVTASSVRYEKTNEIIRFSVAPLPARLSTTTRF